jgi:hypothetical protein
VSSFSNCLYFLTLPLVSIMRVIYTSKGMSKKFGVRVIYRKIRYIITWIQFMIKDIYNFLLHSRLLMPVISDQHANLLWAYNITSSCGYTGFSRLCREYYRNYVCLYGPGDIKSFICPTNAKLNCFNMLQFTLKCTVNALKSFGLTKPLSGSLQSVLR